MSFETDTHSPRTHRVQPGGSTQHTARREETAHSRRQEMRSELLWESWELRVFEKKNST